MSTFVAKADYELMIKQARLDQATDINDDLLDEAEATAIQVVRDALYSRYNVDDIFAQTGDDRAKQVVRWVLTLSIYYIYDRLPDRIIPERVKENYQDTINILTAIEDGKKSVELPLLTDADNEDLTKFRWGSRKARTHDPFLDQYNE